jgi:Zn-dependent protease
LTSRGEQDIILPTVELQLKQLKNNNSSGDVLDPIKVTFFILYWVIFLYSVVLHELAHGWSSLQLGDPTALKAGRLTLNPIKHIEPFSSIILPIMCYFSTGMIFGGARPVPINPYHYRNLRRGMIISAAAGPVTNLIIAAFLAMGLKIFLVMSGGEVTLTCKLLSCGMMINLILAAFNMLPIPPLDGSHILEALLPKDLAKAYGSLRNFGLFILIGLLLFPPTSRLIGLALYEMVQFMGYLLGVDPGTIFFNPRILLK